MGARILIVEDEAFIAADLAESLAEMGYEPIGIAADAKTAFRLASQKPELALVDLNLRDGMTGPRIGEKIAGDLGIDVIFVTANPHQLDDGVPGTIGVIGKPANAFQIGQAIDYALARRKAKRAQSRAPAPPNCLQLFAFA